MPFSLKEKLVVAITSSALFDMGEEDEVFRSSGIRVYKDMQKSRKFEPLGYGTAFHFINSLLKLNNIGQGHIIEVILLSRNDPYSGYRVLNNIEQYGLNISRSLFLSGKSPLDYITPLHVNLFLSANILDVRQAINAGYPAGLVLPGRDIIPFEDEELRVAFDFDGVIADDEAERVYHSSGDLNRFHTYESINAGKSHSRGPLASFLEALCLIRSTEEELSLKDPSYKRKLRISIVTARNAPSHHRLFTTLDEWGIEVDDIMLLGGINKADVLNVLKPHIFFDDQMTHLQEESSHLPSIHIPFGVKNL